MAITASMYNHTANRFQSGANAAGDVYKAILLSASASFVATHTTINQVTNTGAYEVSGNGWTAGGETLAGVTIPSKDTNDSMFDANDISVDAVGGDIGPASAVVLVNSTDGTPEVFINFGEARTANVGTPFKITWDAAGIVEVLNAG